MATVKLMLRGTKNPSNINIRFVNGRQIDFTTPIGIFVNPSHWDSKNQKIKNVIEIQNRDEINSRLSKLKIHCIDQFNNDFSTGKIINKIWFENVVKTFFNRPKDENKKVNLDYKIYLTDFADYWINNKADKHKVSASKFMDETTKNHYKKAIELIKDFEGKDKIIMSEITTDKLDELSIYLTDKKNYSKGYVERLLSRVRFFFSRAEDENISVSKQYRNTIFIADDKNIDYKDPYLNNEEIERIFKYDFSFSETFDNVRDNLIIGLRTGLRVSDFLTRLNINNINGDFIKIKTKKTNTWVEIPIHKQVRYILDKRNGELPSKISDQKFNKYIKLIGQICDIDEVVFGGATVKDEKTKISRKVFKKYKKYELITSHICRKSFATNLHGKVPNSVICSIGGWATEEMMLHYIKQTNRESAMILKEHWDNQK